MLFNSTKREESNHDPDMLRAGPYPWYLKRRILSERGHLSNDDCAALACRLAESGTRQIILGHLSRENNTEEIALSKMRQALEGRGLSVGDASNAASQRDRDVQIYALPRYISSSWFVLA